jgi:hypothetical protein
MGYLRERVSITMAEYPNHLAQKEQKLKNNVVVVAVD